MITVPDSPSILETIDLANRFLEFAQPGAPGWELLRARLGERFSAEARLGKAAREIEEEFVRETEATLRCVLECADDVQRAAAWRRVTDDPEVGMLLANYMSDAFREPLRERRRM